MQLNCPKSVFIQEILNCYLMIEKAFNYSLIIDFGTENKTRVLYDGVTPYFFNVSYSLPGHYLLRVLVENHTMNVQTTIYGNCLIILKINLDYCFKSLWEL